MSRFHSYLNSASAIISAFNGEEPLAAHLKKYFGLHKKHGSSDRKIIAHLCYGYYRLGHSLRQLSIQDRILTGLFLSSEQPHEVLAFYKPDWNGKTSLPLEKKLDFLHLDISPGNIFPWVAQLSEKIETELFSFSHLHQPDLFLRIRPGNESAVKTKLVENNIQFNEVTASCIALRNTTKIDQVFKPDKEVVVQDFSSQRIEELLSLINKDKNSSMKVWDCCAGSGGKSILARDVLGNFFLTVTDIRDSILANLDSRFKIAGIRNYKSVTANVSREIHQLGNEKFDLVIADVPCTGSGTWARTPEQLFFFKKESLEKFSRLQGLIVKNISPYVKTGGYLLYITCSVFREENENVVQSVMASHEFEIVEKKLFDGYKHNADTLFGCLLRKGITIKKH